MKPGTEWTAWRSTLPTIDIAELARQVGVRRKRIVLRAIKPTQMQARELARIYVQVPDEWARMARERLLSEYERTLSELQTDSVVGLEAIIKFIEDAVSIAIQVSVRNATFAWANSMAEWHFRRMVANLKYATNIDASTVLTVSGTQMTLDEFMARNVALIRDVSEQTRGRVADIVYRNLSLRTPIRDVAREISEATGLGRKRAIRIAMDQTQKLSAQLDRERMQQVGITEFEWQHSGKIHYRPEHLARDGKVFSWDSDVAKNDPPGAAPFCGCHARGVIS